MQYRQARVMAGKGSSPENFTATLRSLWIDGQDRLFAAGDAQIKVFDAAGTLRRVWGTARPATAVAVAGDGSIYAGGPGQVEVFDPSGKPIAVWRKLGLLGEVSAIGFAGGSVLIGDVAGRCIRRCDKAGNLINAIGSDNRTNGLLIPNGAVSFGVDASGTIHAANPGKHRVERYTGDGALLGHVGRFDGIDPAGFPGCCNPTNVTVGPLGRIYVTEKAGPRAKVLDADGKLIAVIASDVFHELCKNMSIAVDSRGRVYVADTVKLHIYVFEPVEAQP